MNIDIKLKTYEQLQFEITKLNTDIFLKDKEIERLEQENKELKFENGNLKTNEQINIEVHNKQLEIIKDYKSRNEKIREYIEKQTIRMKEGNILLELNVDELLNILNGSDDK